MTDYKDQAVLTEIEMSAQTPQERYESGTGIDTLSMPGRNR